MNRKCMLQCTIRTKIINFSIAWIAMYFHSFLFSFPPLAPCWQSCLACWLLQLSSSMSMTTEGISNTYRTKKKPKRHCKKCKIHISRIQIWKLRTRCFSNLPNENGMALVQNRRFWKSPFTFKLNTTMFTLLFCFSHAYIMILDVNTYLIFVMTTFNIDVIFNKVDWCFN